LPDIFAVVNCSVLALSAVFCSSPGLPYGAKFGKSCQKSLFSKKFVNFFGSVIYCQNFAIFEISFASIDKTVHFGLFIKRIPKL